MKKTTIFLQEEPYYPGINEGYRQARGRCEYGIEYMLVFPVDKEEAISIDSFELYDASDWDKENELDSSTYEIHKNTW